MEIDLFAYKRAIKYNESFLDNMSQIHSIIRYALGRYTFSEFEVKIEYAYENFILSKAS